VSNSNRRRLTGRVTSDKMDKTVVVAVDHTMRHPLYRKVVRTTKKYMAHDEENQCAVGDIVRIVESRPISKHKRWVVQEIVKEKAG
jgi:small subunit ribosomal protein S17